MKDVKLSALGVGILSIIGVTIYILAMAYVQMNYDPKENNETRSIQLQQTTK